MNQQQKQTSKHTVMNQDKGGELVEKLNAIYIGDHNYPLIEYQVDLWNYTTNSCDSFTIICDDNAGTYSIPTKVFELARQPQLIKRVGRELI